MKATDQQKLILDYNGNAVVIAAPGSGKTFVISNKIKLNLKGLLDHQGVIAISYTNKASIELRNRSLSNGENPCSSFFGTIDKFNLSEIIIPFGKQLYGLPDNDIQIVKIGSLSDEQQENYAWVTRFITLENITNEQLHFLKALFLAGLILIESIGVLANYIFSNSLACQKYIKARYNYIYIDEYQDSGSEQHQIFLKIKSLGIIAVAVGDLNQSIYAFSGKDAKFLEELTEDDDFRYFKLDKNHRCHPGIINYSNYLLNPKTVLIDTKINPIYFRRIEGGDKEIAKFLDENVEKLQMLFNIEKKSKIAILTRFTRTAEIIDANLQMPHHFAISNDLDNNLNIWSGIFSNLLHFLYDPIFKFTDAIEAFSTYDSFPRNELKKLSELKKGLEMHRLNLLGDKIKLLTIFQSIAQLVAPNSINYESIKLLEAVLNSANDLRSYQATNESKVNILTLHKSKGMEYDLIIHLDLHEWSFPSKRPGENNDFKNPVYSDWQQDLNLHYVGVTRARKVCLLISSTKRLNNNNEIKNGSNSEFLTINGIDKLRYKPQNLQK
jgi:DNA helicase-2/ATP-dependent DNA helicase PcrA